MFYEEGIFQKHPSYFEVGNVFPEVPVGKNINTTALLGDRTRKSKQTLSAVPSVTSPPV